MAGMVTGGLFNAVAFAGAGFLFSKLNHTGYSEEIKRHNLATEALSKAKEEWYEAETARRNEVEDARRKLDDANTDINNTNKALDQLDDMLKRRVFSLESNEQREPELSDFYKPSDEMETYQMMTVAAIGLGSGFVGHRVYRRYTS